LVESDVELECFEIPQIGQKRVELVKVLDLPAHEVKVQMLGVTVLMRGTDEVVPAKGPVNRLGQRCLLLHSQPRGLRKR
jgi:hypothetical protein